MTTTIVAYYGRNPFLVLISCLLSLRTRDKTTLQASVQLFNIAKTPEEFLVLPVDTLEKLIYPVGFYHKKAQLLKTVSHYLITHFGGKVPKSKEELLAIPGVGLKTANLVLGEGFGIPAICVDTHVHRISNRLGLVATKSADQTEEMLKKILPQEYWIEFNRLLVIWGQNICVPISPFCSKCAIYDLCERNGVYKNR